MESEVTWEDQQNINTFGRLNSKFHELEDEIKIRKVGLRSCVLRNGHPSLTSQAHSCLYESAAYTSGLVHK